MFKIPKDAVRLKGDASSRSFYRIKKNKTHIILMVFPDEEPYIMQAKRFGIVRDWLSKLDIPVPEIYDISPDGLTFLLEDLGDVLLFDWLKEADKIEIEKAYEILTDYLLRIAASKEISIFPQHLCLNAEALEKELLHFHRYYFDNRGDDRLLPFYKKLALSASKTKLIPAHRDYHSRNILVHNNKFYLIDFQDARFAHPLYDIASFLYDAYVNIGNNLRGRLIKKWDEYSDLRVVALQRNIKAIGTFAYQYRVKKNDFYLQFISCCLNYAKKHYAHLKWDYDITPIFNHNFTDLSFL
ncbi:MAG: aminoglycoside phosphotransferase family protein [Candidatus Hydrogenedentota bacterium]